MILYAHSRACGRNTILRIWGSGVRISSGAPLANKTGHSGRGRAAAHDKPFENGFSANDPDFRVIHLHLVDDRADIGAPEGFFACQYV